MTMPVCTTQGNTGKRASQPQPTTAKSAKASKATSGQAGKQAVPVAPTNIVPVAPTNTVPVAPTNTVPVAPRKALPVAGSAPAMSGHQVKPQAAAQCQTVATAPRVTISNTTPKCGSAAPTQTKSVHAAEATAPAAAQLQQVHTTKCCTAGSGNAGGQS